MGGLRAPPMIESNAYLGCALSIEVDFTTGICGCVLNIFTINENKNKTACKKTKNTLKKEDAEHWKPYHAMIEAF